MKTHKFSQYKYLFITAIFIVLSLFLSVSGFAYISFNGIEYVKEQSEKNGDTFVILEILPQALNGSIGFYVANEEPIQSFVTSEAELNSRISQLTAAGLYALDGSAPLNAVQNSTEAITTGFVNNNWFKKYVLNDENTTTDVEIISMTPSMLEINADNLNSLDKVLQRADMIILSAGFDTLLNTDMHEIYSSNDISPEQAVLLKSAVLPQDNKKGIPLVFDARVATVDGTNIAKLALEVAAGKDMTSGFVFKNIYCYAPTLTLEYKRPQLATSDFSAPYEAQFYEYSSSSSVGSFDNVADNFSEKAEEENREIFVATQPFLSVIDEIRLENYYREQFLRGQSAPEDFYVPEAVTMATSIRHIINYSYAQSEKPSVFITDSGGYPVSTLLIPTIYNSTSLSGTVLSAQNQTIGFELSDFNTYRDNIEVYLYYESDSGEYYHDTTLNEMKLYSEATKTTESVQKFARLPMPQSIIDSFNALCEKDEVIQSEFYTLNLASEITSSLASANKNDIKLYLQANVYIGYRNYNSLSQALTLQKLGLLPLG